MLCTRPRIARGPMLKLERKALVILLVAVSALTSASSALALDDAKPSKPLNLLSFARNASAKARRPVVPPSPEEAAVRATAWAAGDAAPVTTGAVPDNPTAPTRPARAGSASAPPKPAPPSVISQENEVAQFCSNVVDPAVDARLAWQLTELAKAETKLRERIAEVEAKRAEYERWMALRDEFLKKAEASVVE